MRPIEANPLRFGGWCATDIAAHGRGFCLYTARFSRPLELRRIEDPRQPVFAFLFVRVRDNELDQLDEVLRADLTEYVRLD